MSSSAISEPPSLRRANDVFANALAPPKLLFDEFWREGELALLFGTHGVGKSLLAVEIAEALARGRGVEGLEMPATRQNVLYVDLVLSDSQFGWRYSTEGRRATRPYKFSPNFFRDRPAEDENLAKWLCHKVKKHKVHAVVIDDLSVISHTDNGTKQTLELVRAMRRMTREMGISVLMLADSHPYVFGRESTERDLRRTRVLCAYADSVFTLSGTQNSPWRHLVQTRTQAGHVTWTHRSPAHLKMATRDDGFVGFEFVDVDATEEELEMIRKIREIRVGGRELMSFRRIAAKLGISKSTAARLDAKWKPEFDVGPQAASLRVDPVGTRAPSPPVEIFTHPDDEAADRENHERYDFDPDEPFEEDDEAEARVPAPTTGPTPHDWSRVPFAAALGRRSILDLERDYDHNGHEIFVESREEHSGKPKVYYKRRPRGGVWVKHVRDGFGVSGSDLTTSHLLPPDREIKLATRGRAPPITYCDERDAVVSRNLGLAGNILCPRTDLSQK